MIRRTPLKKRGRIKKVNPERRAKRQKRQRSKHAAVYLDLVRHFLGADAEKALRAGYKEQGVKHRPKRVLTPERLETMRERGRQLAASRR